MPGIVVDKTVTRTGYVEASGTGLIQLVFAIVFANRWQLTHLYCQDEGGEAVVRTVEVVSDVTVIHRQRFVSAAAANTFTGIQVTGPPILIARGVQTLTVRLLASGAIAVMRRLGASARLIPDTEIGSGI